jgi:hypothetical protein
MIDLDLRHLVTYHSDRGDLPVPCVMAFCVVESSLNEWAYRYEPQYKWLVGDVHSISPTERIGQMISWGLMQVMGGVAREHGFNGIFTELCDPTIGLRYGMLHLSKHYAKHKNWPDAIASYNAGSPRKNEAGQYHNQTYVDKILKAWAAYEQHVPLKDSEA